MNYYNDNDPKAARWLRALIEAGLIPYGDVDDRSILDVEAKELRGYTQCHFFAGIGGWAYALELTGWPTTRHVWTGSCPCQPLSVAGLGRGERDERHLWPEFARLIRDGNPSVVFGEQVASKDGREWLSGVRADLEAMGYAVGASDLCAAGVGAPHIRQRLYWVADSDGEQNNASNTRGFYAEPSSSSRLDDPLHGRYGEQAEKICTGGVSPVLSGIDSGLGNAESNEQQWNSLPGTYREGIEAGGSSSDSRLADSIESGLEGYAGDGTVRNQPGRNSEEQTGSVAEGGSNFWADFDLTPCGDGKTRRVKPGVCLLAHGIPARVGRLRGYGNAIVPQVAAGFIKAFMEIEL